MLSKISYIIILGIVTFTSGKSAIKEDTYFVKNEHELRNLLEALANQGKYDIELSHHDDSPEAYNDDKARLALNDERPLKLYRNDKPLDRYSRGSREQVEYDDQAGLNYVQNYNILDEKRGNNNFQRVSRNDNNILQKLFGLDGDNNNLGRGDEDNEDDNADEIMAFLGNLQKNLEDDGHYDGSFRVKNKKDRDNEYRGNRYDDRYDKGNLARNLDDRDDRYDDRNDRNNRGRSRDDKNDRPGDDYDRGNRERNFDDRDDRYDDRNDRNDRGNRVTLDERDDQYDNRNDRDNRANQEPRDNNYDNRNDRGNAVNLDVRDDRYDNRNDRGNLANVDVRDDRYDDDRDNRNALRTRNDLDRNDRDRETLRCRGNKCYIRSKHDYSDGELKFDSNKYVKKYKVSDDMDAVVLGISDVDRLLTKLNPPKPQRSNKQRAEKILENIDLEHLLDRNRNAKKSNVEAVVFDLTQLEDGDVLAKQIQRLLAKKDEPEAEYEDYGNFVEENLKLGSINLKKKAYKSRADSKIMAHTEDNNNVYVPKWLLGEVLSKSKLRDASPVQLLKSVIPLSKQQKSRIMKILDAKKGTSTQPPKKIFRRNFEQDVGVPFHLEVQGLGQVKP